MEEVEVDIVVIGSGPAGQKAAIQAAKLGRSVVVIEKDQQPGGACLNSGTIPSKSLREAIVDLTRFNQRSFYGGEVSKSEVSINDLNYRLNQVLDEERRVIRRQFRKNNIRLVTGCARFTDRHTIEVVDPEFDLAYRIRTKRVIISSGSTPRNPLDVPFDDEVILDSTRLLAIDRVPKSLIVLGGGIVGSEYASFFAALGTAVTVVDKKGHMLPLLDSEIGIHLQMALSDLDLKFVGNQRPVKISRVGDTAEVQFEDGSTMTAGALLYALGRVAYVEGMGLEEIGLKLSDRGHIPVNDHFQTAIPHIYAVGDVVGAPGLASTSMEQGRLASLHACDEEKSEFPKFFPLGIYTIPEISSVGITEDEARAQGIDYEVGRAYYYEVARGHIAGEHEGMFKLVFDRQTHKILGVHIIGRSATEVIHIGQVAMTFGATIDYFVSQVFNYPTFAEGYRIAALNGMNKIRKKR